MDARRIVERASGYESSDWYAGLDTTVPARAMPFVERMVERRTTGEPLQYVVGRWGFRHLDLLVDHRVLIPRPETEQVVDVAMAELDRTRLAGGERRLRVADLGTGSGAIALSLATERADVEVWASDVSPDACAVATANLAGVGGMAATRVRIVEGSWFAALPPALLGRVHLVVSNPPYVAEDELPTLDAEVADWEPRLALVPGPTGLEAIEQIVAGARPWLAARGGLVIEIAPHQAHQAVELAHMAGFADADVRPDLSGRPRTLVARA